MEPLNTWSIIVLVIASVVSIVQVARMVRSISSDKITLIRKDTGKSVTISREYNRQVSKKLLELVD